MPNTNVLTGLRCPMCGSYEPFIIVSTCTAKVYDDGIEDTTDHEWGPKSPCVCLSCNFSGQIKDLEPKVKPGSGSKKGNPKGGKKRGA